MKFCKRCNAETERYSNGRCKPCQYRRSKKYFLKNRQELIDEMRVYYEKNKERIKEYRKKYSKIYKEKLRYLDKRWREKNKEKVRDISKKYRESNKDKLKACWQNRRAAIKNAKGKITAGYDKVLYSLQKGKCACCRKDLDKYHLDHKMPLALGGTNTDDNIQLLCPRCNLQKGKKHPIDFMQSNGYLL